MLYTGTVRQIPYKELFMEWSRLYSLFFYDQVKIYHKVNNSKTCSDVLNVCFDNKGVLYYDLMNQTLNQSLLFPLASSEKWCCACMALLTRFRMEVKDPFKSELDDHYYSSVFMSILLKSQWGRIHKSKFFIILYENINKKVEQIEKEREARFNR